MSTNRRDFLALVTGALGARVAIPAVAEGRGLADQPPHPDAILLAACAAFDDLERQVQASYGHPGLSDDEVLALQDADDEAREPWQEAQQPLAELIGSTPAKTLEGLRAKAHSLVLWDESAMEDDPYYINDVIRSSLLRDLLG